MSYLLTEIALEMLGYKFYDIEGNLGATNFQSNGRINCNSAAGETEPESLQSVLKLSHTLGRSFSEKETEHLSEAKLFTANDTSSASVEVNPVNGVDINDQKNSNINSNVKPNCSNKTNQPSSQPRENTRRPLPNALSRLLDLEYQKIRSQIKRNKDVYLQSNVDFFKRLDQRSNASIAESLTPFTQQEKLNLQSELQTMHAFRKKIERSLFKFNTENYEKYKRTFVGQSDALDKSSSNESNFE